MDQMKKEINELEVDSTPILEDEQNLKVWCSIEDGAGIELTVRIDLRWVSVADAYAAVQATFLRDAILDEVGDEDGNVPGGISDILVTRREDNGEITFMVLACEREFTVDPYERFRA